MGAAAGGVGGGRGAGGGAGARSRSRYKLRLAAARQVRALSLRFRLSDTGFSWTPWLGIWTRHGSREREGATTLETSAQSALQTLPRLPSRLGGGGGGDARGGVTPLPITDGAGDVCTLSAEHAIASPLAGSGGSGEGGGESGGAGAALAALPPPHTLSIALFVK
jgi:hypothetical protein